jgi:endoglycosylceramidase
MKVRLACTCFVLLMTVSLTAGCTPEPKRSFLTDAQGRQVILHGLNLANTAKYSPTGFSWHTEADYARMQAWGFNAVRLLIFWHRIEPEQDVYDEAYLDGVAQRVRWASDHGLVVLLDMHMDLYGRRFGDNGAPVWATRDDGLPFDRVEPWWVNYTSPAVQAAYSHLYRDEDLKAHYFAMWAHVAARFADDPAVIGYDLQNEPFWGKENPLTFEADFLLPFFQGAIASIRSADPDALCFFKPMIVTSTGFPSFLPPIGDGRTAYSPHFYQVEQHNEGIAYDGNDTVIRNAARTRAREAETHGVPWILAELGIADTVGNFELHLHHLMRALDDYASGWTYYDYEKGPGQQILDSDGNEKPNLWPLIRTYPQKVAGEIDRFSYDPDTRIFELVYRQKEGVTGGTEIYVPATRVYDGHFRLTSTDPEGSWSYVFDADREVVVLTADPESPSHTVKIEPAPGR